MGRLNRSPANGNTIIDFKAFRTPNRSAMTPSMVTPSPPVPIAKPTMSPDCDPQVAGKELLRHYNRHGKCRNQHHAKQTESDEQHDALCHED